MRQQPGVTSEPLDLGWVGDFYDRWLDAWNSHVPDRVLALMTHDIVYDDPAWPTTMRGHADVRAFLDHMWRAFPDMRFTYRDGPYVHPREARAAFLWDGRATHTGILDPPGVLPTNKTLQFDGADFHEYRDGKVARLQIVLDMADGMRQAGVLPPSGSTRERLLAKLINLRRRLPRRD